MKRAVTFFSPCSLLLFVALAACGQSPDSETAAGTGGAGGSGPATSATGSPAGGDGTTTSGGGGSEGTSSGETSGGGTSGGSTSGGGTSPACAADADCAPCERCDAAGACLRKKGDTFVVSPGAATNHADASKRGSIASYLACAAPGERVRLSAGGSFPVAAPLSVPEGVTIDATAGDKPTIVAKSAIQGPMLLLAGQTAIRGISVDGAHRAQHLVRANKVSGVKLENSTFRRTKNDYPSGSDPRCHAIVFISTENVRVASSVIEKAGYPKVNGTTWAGVCAGIYAHGCKGLEVTGSQVRDVLTAGIDFTSTVNAKITNNTVEDNGRNREYGGPVADSITAYHNGLGHTYQNIWVTGNTVRRSGNHGIHISGRDVHIQNNVVEKPWAQGILLMDQKEPHDCASNCTILNNKISGLLSGGNRHAVYIGDNYKPGAIKVDGNGPDVFWKPGTHCQ